MPRMISANPSFSFWVYSAISELWEVGKRNTFDGATGEEEEENDELSEKIDFIKNLKV